MKEKHKLTKPEVIARINDLLANNNQKIVKYQKNYALYNQCPMTDLRAKIPYVVGYIDDVYSDETSVPKLNVIKSAIDAVVSKISTAHCRPFVNTVKGSFKTIQICKQLQTFLDFYYDEKGVPSKIVEALRDACIFDSGFIYFDEETGDIHNIAPWNFYSRQTEKSDFKSCYIEFPNRSVDTLDEKDYDLLTKAEQKNLYVTIGYFYDSNSKTKAILVNRQIRDISEVKFDCVPVVPIYYTMPAVGNSVLSITDMLRGIQIEIDELMKRIAEASVLNPAQTFFLPNASSIKVGQLNNKVGNVVQYNSANGAQPVEVSTPSFISEQYTALLDNLIEKAYNMVGISQLSAQGKKPTGLDSGIALQSMENIESDRFETQLNQVIRAYVDLSKVCISVFPQDEDILPENKTRRSVKWHDIITESKNMSIQYSGADALSKDPSEKLKQLQMLAQAGVIPTSRIAQFIEIPDLQSGYSLTNNAINAVMTLIEQCINNDVMEVPEFIPFQMLKEEIINTQLSLYSANPEMNIDDIEKLNQLYAIAEEKEQEWLDETNDLNNAANNKGNGNNDQTIPAAENVLTQEANMQAVAPGENAPETVQTDLDVAANGAQPGNWNAGV